MAIVEILEPIVAARREAPQDDLISVLVRGRVHRRRRRLAPPHRCRDLLASRCCSSPPGSGTTWKQMGITLAALLQRPDVLDAVRDDRSLLRPAIEESLRWMPTDPMFSRHVTRDIEFHGVHIPKGAVMHLCLGAANRDPARWDRPDEYDITRPPKPALAFGNGPHVCLGMHVARAEMAVGINALLDRLPEPAARPRRRTAELHRHVRTGRDRDPGGVRMTGTRARVPGPRPQRSSARSTSAATARPTARSATSGTACRRCCSRPRGAAAARRAPRR